MNKGAFSEYVGFRVYFPEQVDLLEFNSKSSGPKGKVLNKASSRPLQLAELNGMSVKYTTKSVVAFF